KKDGDAVRADEPLFELETEKATSEVPAPAAGTLHIAVPEGQTVAIGAVVGQIEKGAPPPAEKKKERPPRGAEPPPAASDKAVQKPPQQKGQAPLPEPVQATAAPADVALSPSVRRLVDEEGVDIQLVKGSGPGGRITKEDVLAYLEQRQARTPPTVPE